MNKWVWVSMCALLLAGCARGPDSVQSGSEQTGPQRSSAVTELQRNDTVQGTGEGISQGQVAVVHYTGWLYDPSAPDNKGTKFDSSRDQGRPFRFVVGAGKVIRGWDLGVQGMQVGGQRLLLIPSDLGYGAHGAGGVIPPNAPLLFEVELLAIEADPAA